MSHHCIPCNLPFKSNKCLQQHMKCKRHIDYANNRVPVPRFACGTCGKKYHHRQSLHVHKRSCGVTVSDNPPSATDITISNLAHAMLDNIYEHRVGIFDSSQIRVV